MYQDVASWQSRHIDVYDNVRMMQKLAEHITSVRARAVNLLDALLNQCAEHLTTPVVETTRHDVTDDIYKPIATKHR